ncbi:helix-turn-helix domain-containing protein [Metabacillus herbersteinensis]|uniref:Helix-turn-helix domain-containing protein n=1 Tax=Metabacillus herbersteinensis TaxID=283816 RepID=A0ABV6GIA3_9BACI
MIKIKSSKADLILHPVRMKIIQSLAGGRNLTASQLTEKISDTPQATMYRHLKILLENDILLIAEQNKIRGTVEKVYALTENGTNVTQEDLQNASREDHMEYFMKFVATLLSDFGKYIKSEKIDLEKDGVAYRQANLHLSDQEFMDFAKSLSAVYQKALKNEPSENRTSRVISTIIIPERGSKHES